MFIEYKDFHNLDFTQINPILVQHCLNLRKTLEFFSKTKEQERSRSPEETKSRISGEGRFGRCRSLDRDLKW